MKRIAPLIASSAIALAAMAAMPAHAAGTLAGTEITNTSNVRFKVSGQDQTAVTTTEKVTVDRIIQFTATFLSPQPQVAKPGQTNIVIGYRVSSQSNAAISIHPYSGIFAAGNPSMANYDRWFWDTNKNGTYDAGTDVAYNGSNAPVLDPDTNLTLFNLADAPTVFAHKAAAYYNVYFDAREPNTAGNAATAKIAASTGANTTGIDTILIDSTTYWDPENNGTVNLSPGFIGQSAALTVTRYVTPISDPVNNTTNPKAIPGAVVEYCLAISNAADGEPAANVGITETLGANQVYETGFGIFQNGTVTSGACSANGTAGGTFASGKVSATISSIAAGETKTIRYRAKLN